MLHRHDEARAAAEAGAALMPAEAHTLDTLGVVLTRTGAFAPAADLFRLATGLQPRNPSYLYNLGAALQFVGDMTGAGEAYERALAVDPENYKALSSLIGLSRQTEATQRIAELEARFDPQDADPARQLHIGHALAKTCEDLGRYAEALDWLQRAKTGMRRQRGYALEQDRALFAAAMRTGSPEASGRGPGHDDGTPIFIVGLPRTGTTLLDRVLSSHPDVVSAGELSDFSLILKRMAGTPSPLVLDPDTLDAAAGVDLAEVGRRYVARTRKVAGESPRIIDKMPLNVLNAGLILQALPNARIICLRRDPVDSALSNYRQLFATDFPYYGYSLDLADAGRYYALFDRLVAHWRDTLPPDRFTEVAYEDLVHDLEGQTRRLSAFCGLDFDPACLTFHENAAPVSTASSVQVRSPLYATSIGRWRRYGEGLRPLLDALTAEGIDGPRGFDDADPPESIP
ncbi:sulfotransferase [Brevundimonas sp.]|uniref:sulfotransferase family protein n=1 Tax=Brevundimonas sp. TaxID=1871086 RepID=UPI003919B183